MCICIRRSKCRRIYPKLSKLVTPRRWGNWMFEESERKSFYLLLLSCLKAWSKFLVKGIKRKERKKGIKRKRQPGDVTWKWSGWDLATIWMWEEGNACRFLAWVAGGMVLSFIETGISWKKVNSFLLLPEERW